MCLTFCEILIYKIAWYSCTRTDYAPRAALLSELQISDEKKPRDKRHRHHPGFVAHPRASRAGLRGIRGFLAFSLPITGRINGKK